MTGIDLAAFAPASCGRGHLLGPGRVTVGWRPCACPATQEAGTSGHVYVRCRQCEVEGAESVYLDPPHEDEPAG